MAQSVKHLPSAQILVSGSWDRVLHQASCSAGSLLLPLPLLFPLLVLSLNLSQINKMLFLKFYLFITERHTEREAETKAEGEAGSMQGARCRTRSQDPGVTPWAEGRRSTAEPPWRPHKRIYREGLVGSRLHP